jgi:hypothetical protein
LGTNSLGLKWDKKITAIIVDYVWEKILNYSHPMMHFNLRLFISEYKICSTRQFWCTMFLHAIHCITRLSPLRGSQQIAHSSCSTFGSCSTGSVYLSETSIALFENELTNLSCTGKQTSNVQTLMAPITITVSTSIYFYTFWLFKRLFLWNLLFVF